MNDQTTTLPEDLEQLPQPLRNQTVQITPGSFTPSPELQQQIEAFHASRQAYLDAQAVYQQTVHETRRLEQTATALETEAEAANASWKEMAKARHADQRKINAEVERSVQLGMDAEKFRRTARVREELHGEIVVQMEKARQEMRGRCELVRVGYVGERIRALLATEGLAEILGELRGLTQYAAQMEGHGSLMAELKVSDFGSMLAKAAKQDAEPHAIFTETALPPAIAGEVHTTGGIQLVALEVSNGKTSSLPEARRMNPEGYAAHTKRTHEEAASAN